MKASPFTVPTFFRMTPGMAKAIAKTCRKPAKAKGEWLREAIEAKLKSK